MHPPIPKERALIDWGVAARPISGETVSGDLHQVIPFDDRVLVAVIDGVGHGVEAAAASRVAADILESYAGESTIALIQRCHQALLLTRGVVLTVAKLNPAENTMTWLGVGNVEGRLLRADPGANHPRESVLLRGGLVGCQLPELRASVVPVAVGDLLVLATDGIQAGFENEIKLNETPGQIAEKILSHHYRGNDDALVLVARYLGMHHE